MSFTQPPSAPPPTIPRWINRIVIWLLLLGIRTDFLAAIGALLIASSMVGATVAHVRAGNLFAEVPWTLIFFGLCLIVVLLQWQVLQDCLRRL